MQPTIAGLVSFYAVMTGLVVGGFACFWGVAIALWRLSWMAALKLFGILVAWGLLTVYVLFAEVLGCMGGGCADGKRDLPLSLFYCIASVVAAIVAVWGVSRWAPRPDWAQTSLLPPAARVNMLCCNQCSSAIPVDAKRCPNCGLDFGAG